MSGGTNQNLVSAFQNISQGQVTGTLYVFEGEKVKYLYFEQGKLIYLSFYVPTVEKIGISLVNSYKITGEQMQDIYARAAAAGLDPKDAMINDGVITTGELKEVMQTLVEDEFCEMFQWAESQTSIQEGPPDPQIFNKGFNTLKINFDVENMIKWIEKKIDEHFTIFQWIPALTNVYALIGPVYDKLDPAGFNALDRQVAEFLDGNYTVENICSQLRQSYYKVGKSIIKLLSQGAAELSIGQGPTTSISNQINTAQAAAGYAPSAQPTPTPPPAPAPAPVQDTPAPAAKAPTKAEDTEDKVGTEPDRDRTATSPPDTAAKNVLAYETTTIWTARNIAIGAAILIAAGVILWFVFRDTPDKIYDRLMAQRAQYFPADGPQRFDEWINALDAIVQNPSFSIDLKGKAQGAIAKTQVEIDTLADEDIAEARTLAEANKLNEAVKRLEATDQRSKKAARRQEIVDILAATMERLKVYTAEIAAVETVLESQYAAAQAIQDQAAMLAMCGTLSVADKKYLGFALWENKRDSYVRKFRVLRDSVDEKLTVAWLTELNDTRNLKKVEDGLHAIAKRNDIRAHMPESFGDRAAKAITTVRSQARGECDAIEAGLAKNKFSQTMEAIAAFNDHYPWYEDIGRLAEQATAVQSLVAANDELLRKATEACQREQLDAYREAIGLFEKIEARSRHFDQAAYKAGFLKDLLKALDGWQTAANRNQCLRALDAFMGEQQAKLNPEDRELVLRWRDKIEDYEKKSNDQFKNILDALARDNQIDQALTDLERLIKDFPESTGSERATRQREEIKSIMQAAQETAGKIAVCLDEHKYDAARDLKEAFVKNRQPWAQAMLPVIPLFVKAYPAGAAIRVNGREKDIVEGDEPIEVSHPGFTGYKGSAGVVKGRNYVLVVLNRTPAAEKAAGVAVTAQPIVADRGVVCPTATGVDLYDANGAKVWSREALEGAAGNEPAIRFPAVYQADLGRIFILGRKKLHIVDAVTGAKIKEDNLPDSPETPLLLKEDPLIGKRFYLYLGTFARDILCINGENLRPQWPQGYKTAEVALNVVGAGDAIVAATRDDAGTIHVVDFRSGLEFRKVALGSRIILPVQVENGILYAALASNQIAAMDIAKCAFWLSPRLTVNRNDRIVDFTVRDKRAFVVVGENQTRVMIADLAAEGAALGEVPMFEPLFSDRIAACTADDRGLVYFITRPTGEQPGGIWAWDDKARRLQWQFFEKDLDLYAPVFTPTQVIAVGRNGRMLVFNREAAQK
ncbi:MAG: DUF4388 domain-containing protein [Planctomycetota bacterium]